MNPTKFMSLITHHSRRNKSQSPVHGLLGPWDSTSSCLLGPYLQIFPNSFLSHPCLLINSQNCQGPPAKGTLLYSVMSYCLDKLYGSAPPTHSCISHLLISSLYARLSYCGVLSHFLHPQGSTYCGMPILSLPYPVLLSP